VTRRPGAARERREPALERAIDDVLAASFPASDPPQWDSLAARRVAEGDHSTTGSSTQTPISSSR
jgi:hypothetical protein